MLRSLWSAIQCGRHHGKGLKFKDRGTYETSWKHFQNALKYAASTGNAGTVALETECIAWTYLQMKQKTEAKEFAERSFALYQNLRASDKKGVFSARVSGLEDLLNAVRT
jgi:hypothetical protein